MRTLDPALKQKLEAQLGREVPDAVQSDAFDAFLDDLARREPALYREVVEAIYGGGSTPAEAQAARVARREGLRHLLTRLFYHPNARGQLVVDKRKTGLLLALGALGVMGAVYALSLRLTPPVGEIVQPASERVVEVPVPRPEAVVDVPDPPVTQRSPAPLRPENVPPEAVHTPPPPPTRPPSNAPVLVSPPPAAGTPAATDSATPAALPTRLTFDTGTDAMATEQPPSVLIPGQASGPATLGRPGASGPPGLSADASGVPPAERPAHLVLAETNVQRPPSLGARDERVGANVVPSRPATLALGSGVGAVQQMETDGGSRFPSASLPSPGEAPPTPAPATGPPTPSPASLTAGMRLRATLTTAVALLEGGTAPVVAETRGSWCGDQACPPITWIGEASLVQPNRVGLEFTQAVIGDAQEQVRAVAFGPDALPGVPAAVRDTTPTLAQDLLRGTAGGITRYVEALVAQQTVTEDGGRTVIESALPSLENFLLGSVTDLFDIPDDQTTVVRIAEVPAGTPVTLLYGVDTGR